MVSERRRNYEVGANPALSKKEFETVLGRILLNPPKSAYTVSELEFEFDLKWEHLKPLLDEHSTYTQDGEKIVINGFKPKKISEIVSEEESQEEKEHFAEIENFFYKRYKYRRLTGLREQVYGRVTLKKEALNSLNPKLIKALLFGEDLGLVIVTENHIDNTITFRLHHYFRPKYHGPKSR